MKKAICNFILFNILLFTELKISAEGKEFSSLSDYCQWKPVQYSSRNKCIERCDKSKGFVKPGTTQIVCFNEEKHARLISLRDEETKRKQCGYKVTGRVAAAALPCNPKVVCGNVTDTQCAKECHKYTTYISRTRSRIAKVSYCGQTSEIKWRIRTLDTKASEYNITRQDGTRNNVFNCTCGFGEEGKEVQREPHQRKQRRMTPNEGGPNKMVATCPNVLLKYNKNECEGSCRKMNGIYSQQNNEFFCFHSEWNVTVFQSTEEYCECKAYIKFLKSKQCPPERKIKLRNKDERLDCLEKCASYRAYVFSPNRLEPETVYCEKPSYVFRNLSYEIGKIVVVDIFGSRSENKKYRKYECKCGLRLSQSEIDSKINDFLTNNDGRNTVRKNLQLRNQSDIRSNEKETSDSQAFANMNIIPNEWPNDLSDDGSDFLYDLIGDDEITINNGFDFPIVGSKRSSNQINLRDFEETDRGKKKVNQITNDEIEQWTDLEIPWTSGYHTASPKSTHIASSSSSHMRKVNRNKIGNDEDDIFDANIFAVTGSSSIRNEYFNSPRSGVPALNFNLSEILSPGDFEPPPTLCSHMSQQNIAINDNIEASGSYSQNRRPIPNNESQNIGFINRETMQNDSINVLPDNMPAGPMFLSIWDEDDTSCRSQLDKSRSIDSLNFLFPNVTMEINELIRPAVDLKTNSMSAHHTQSPTNTDVARLRPSHHVTGSAIPDINIDLADISQRADFNIPSTSWQHAKSPNNRR